MWIKANWGAASKQQEKNKVYIKLVWSRDGYFGLTAPGLTMAQSEIPPQCFHLSVSLRGCLVFDN